jgi:hypothetical protein
MNNSIFEHSFVNPILETARGTLEKDGTLTPVLFVNIGVPEIRVVFLSLPNAPVEKQAEFRQIGTQFRARRETIQEAVFVSEGWVVRPTEAPGGLQLPPSQHPCRQEAIVLVGRNAKATCHTYVIQPFTRNAANQPVWGKLALAAYNEPVQQGNRAEGLLDYLFAANQQR